MVSLGKIKQTKIQSASACQLAAYKCFYSKDWLLKLIKKKKNRKQNPKNLLGPAIRIVASSMSSVVRLKTVVEWKVGLSQEQVSYTNSSSTIEFLRQQVHVMCLDGSSQEIFHITHFTSSQVHSDSKPRISIQPKIVPQVFIFNSCLPKFMHELKYFKGMWLNYPWFLAFGFSFSCISNLHYFRYILMFRSDLTLKGKIKSWLLTLIWL